MLKYRGMANKLDPMDIKQMITLHLLGESNREISTLIGVSRNTVNHYIRHLKSLDIDMSLLSEMSNSSLSELFPGKSPIDLNRYNTLVQTLHDAHKNINQPGFTFRYHWNEYYNKHIESSPYGYTQFMEHYNRLYKVEQEGSAKLNHEAGRELYVDYAGKRLSYHDKSTGLDIPVETFVTILPFSHQTYAEVSPSQKRHDFIKSLSNSLSFYGGVPKAIVTDNLKSAVSRASKYEPDVNRSLKEFAVHYGCAINPTRSYSPQDKALVENAVKLVYQRIYYPMRNMVFFSIDDINKEMRKHLLDFNNIMFQQKKTSRNELFKSLEFNQLKKLPSTIFELKGYRRAKVQKIGYVYFSGDKNYYSVPYQYIGRSTIIQYTDSYIEIYFNYERIATHKRNKEWGYYTTNKEHLSSTHKAYSNWSPDFFKDKAKKHGEYVLKLIETLFVESEYPEISYKKAAGILSLCKYYDDSRLNNACMMVVNSGETSYKVVKNILNNNMDKQVCDEDLSDTQSHIPAHKNIRGKQHFI